MVRSRSGDAAERGVPKAQPVSADFIRTLTGKPKATGQPAPGSNPTERGMQEQGQRESELRVFIPPGSSFWSEEPATAQLAPSLAKLPAPGVFCGVLPPLLPS